MKLSCPNSVRLGKQMRRQRVREGMTLRETAQKIGISHATLSRVERGHPPSYETWRHIHEWLKGK